MANEKQVIERDVVYLRKDAEDGILSARQRWV